MENLGLHLTETLDFDKTPRNVFVTEEEQEDFIKTPIVPFYELISKDDIKLLKRQLMDRIDQN